MKMTWKPQTKNPPVQVPESVVAAGGADRPRHRRLLGRRHRRPGAGGGGLAPRAGPLVHAACERGGERDERGARGREHEQR